MPPRIRPLRRPSRRPARCARSATGYSSSAISAGRIAQFEVTGRWPSSPGASRRAPPPPPRMSASSVSRPERGSTAWKTSAGNDTWLAATERSGSSSHKPLDQHVGQPLHRQVACTQRRREGRVEHAALRRDHPHPAGQPGVLGDGRPEEGADGEVRAGVRAGDRHVHARGHLRRAPPSDRRPGCRRPTETTACTRTGSVVHALVVEEALGLHRRARARRGRPPRPGGRSNEQRLHPGPHRVAAVRVANSATRVMPRRQAANCASRSPSVEAGSRTWRRSSRRAPHPLAGLDQLHRGRSALLEELRALGALGAGEPPADVDVMGDRAGPGDDPPCRKSGVNTCRSGVWVPPMYGWLVRKASPSTTSSPHFARTASSANCISPSWAGICSEFAIMRPSAVNRPQLKSRSRG